MKSPVGLALLPLLLAAPLWAQDSPDPACPGGAVSYIFIDNHSIFDTTDPSLSTRFAWAYGLANSLHVRTRASVIRRELLFRVGDCYDPFLLEETERILRGHDFLSRIDVFGIRQAAGDYHVVVDTQDEWSTQVDLRVRLSDGLQFDGARLRESNLLGTGQSVSLFYVARDVNRDYGVAFETPQLLRSRWHFGTAIGRSRAGTTLTQTIAHPFVGEIGRWAARQSVRRQDWLFDYIARDDQGEEMRVVVPIQDRGADLALVGRLGRRGNLTVFGGALSFQERSYLGPAEVVHGRDFEQREVADSILVAPVTRQLNPIRNVRAFLLLGQRNIGWVKRRGLDTMRGQQDVPLGTEVELALGRSLPGVEEDDDIFGTFTLHGGVEVGDLLVLSRVRGEGRRDFGQPALEWQDIFAQAELLSYLRPPSLPNQTLFLRLAGAGGWHTRTPFQLTLGGDEALRGYRPERFPGGARVIATLEDRIYFGWPMPDVLDLGGTVFLDVGRAWAGDAPFGAHSDWRGSAGAGLRGAFPAGGRTTYRLDLAFPFQGGGGPRLMLSIGESHGLARRFGDPQLLRSRQAGVSGELFRFPN
jgi:hypothetical protein